MTFVIKCILCKGDFPQNFNERKCPTCRKERASEQRRLSKLKPKNIESLKIRTNTPEFKAAQAIYNREYYEANKK